MSDRMTPLDRERLEVLNDLIDEQYLRLAWLLEERRRLEQANRPELEAA